MNNVELSGNLTRNAETRYTQSGKPVTNARMAANDSYFAQGEQHTNTLFINLVMWGKRAEALVKSGGLRKGDSLIVTNGSLRIEDYQDKDGKAKTFSGWKNVDKITEKSLHINHRRVKDAYEQFLARQVDVAAGEAALAERENREPGDDQDELGF